MADAATDPYYLAQDQVQVSIKKLNDLADSWSSSVSTGVTSSGPSEELASELAQCEVDLRDLEGSIQVVEANPDRFNISPSDLASRKKFVATAKRQLKSVNDRITATKRQVTRQDVVASLNIRRPGNDGADAFVRSQQQQHQALLVEQDQQLEELALSAERLNHTAVVINNELADQQRLLKELDEDIDRQTEKMNFVMRRMAKVLKTNDTKTLYLILSLVVILLVMVFLVMYI